MTARRPLLLLLILLALAPAHPALAADTGAAKADAVTAELQKYATRHYTVYTNLPRKLAEGYGRHIDKVYDEYEALFRRANLPPREPVSFPLYLFQTQQEYVDFLATYEINAANSGGMFFIRPNVQGLATYTGGRSVAETLAVLQHEGFHQFAYRFFGASLPIWVNEGLAQYYEDGVMLGRELHLGLASARRTASVRAALQAGNEFDTDKLLAMTTDDWQHTLHATAQRANLLYDQSWSIVYFLIHGENGRYLKAFETYLRLLAGGGDAETAFKETIGARDALRRWRQFAAQAKPDPLPVAMEQMEFLARGLLYLTEHEPKSPTPRTMAELRSRLQKVGYRATRTLPGGAVMQYDSSDEKVYRYPLGTGGERMFDLLEPSSDNLPPRLSAPGLRPAPTLTWSRDEEGKLQMEFLYR